MKQSNKKHKGKSKRKSAFKSDGPKLTKVIKKQTKRERKQMLKERKKTLLLERKKIDVKVGGHDNAPLLVAIVPLANTSKAFLAANLLKYSDDKMEILQQTEKFIRMSSPMYKKQVDFVCSVGWQNLCGTLDVCKIADRVIFLCPASTEQISHRAVDMVSAIFSQGAPHSIYAVMSNNANFTQIRSEIEQIFQLPSDRVWPLNDVADSQKLMRHICLKSISSTSGLLGLKKTEQGIFRVRPSMLVENVEVIDSSKVCIHGYLRNQVLHLHQHVHILDFGDYPLLNINCKGAKDVIPIELSDKTEDEFMANLKKREEEDFKLMRGYYLDSNALETLDEDVDMMSDSDEFETADSDEEEGEKLGDNSSTETASEISHYEDVEMESENEEADEGEEDNMKENNDDNDVVDENSDPTQIFKKVPVDVPARVAFAKYTGIPSLKKTEFPLHENLPSKYSTVVKFPNFTHARHRFRNHLKEIHSGEDQSVQPGAYVQLTIQNCPAKAIAAKFAEQPLIMFGLLPCENRLSVLHMSIKPSSIYHEHVELPTIKSKDSVMMQMGFRRMIVCPIFSKEVKHTDRYLFARFLPREGHLFATIYGPLTFLPTPVLMWRISGEQEDTTQTPLGELIATGTIATINPDILILKRILLSGKPAKVKNTAIRVRGMFHNPEDVEYFKEVPLFTFAGDEGKIFEPVGTHGIMKCRMRKTMKRQIDVLMPLYKRQFPV